MVPTGPRCQLEICWRCVARYDSMKKDKRLAHAPHCYWHAENFELWKRAPPGEAITDWDGMLQTSTSDPSHARDFEMREQVLKANEAAGHAKGHKLNKARE